MAEQALIIHIDEALIREVRRLLAESGKGYASLSEFVEVALINQLGAERAIRDGAREVATGTGPAGVIQLLATPKRQPETLAPHPEPGTEGLFVLTNRFGPIKIAARVLANMGGGGEWPDLTEFQTVASGAARDLGLRLREEDESAGRSGPQRRWVAFPVGSDERAARDRFAFSFTLDNSGSTVGGPMVTLGLANLNMRRAALTELGWRLAAAPSPLLGESEGLRFSPAEGAIMREAVCRAPGELTQVVEFIALVREASGSQTALDELLAARHPEWTRDLATAHRSAMLGRLADLEILEVTGRGPKANITLLEAAEEFGAAEFNDGASREETS
jgi:hypothetical protein